MPTHAHAARALSIAVVFVPAAIAACSSNAKQPVTVSLAPTIVMPRALLDAASALALTVYDGTTTGATCDAKTGLATGVTASTAKVASLSLGTTNCPNGDKFCGSLQITKSTDTLVFAALATSASGGTVANGCATATMNQDALDVNITMVRFVAPATCGNGVVEATEQCDPPAAPDAGDELVCDTQCHSKEETLFSGNATTEGAKTALLWPANGSLLSFYTDEVSTNPIHFQVGLRVMNASLEIATTPSAAENAILAPNGSSAFPPDAVGGNQKHPAAAFENGTYWYAFDDDSTNGDPDIHIRSFDNSLSFGVAKGINGSCTQLNDAGACTGDGLGEPNQQLSPSIAIGPNGSILVAWQDVTAGQIMARTFTPPNILGTENQLSTGSGNENVVVAATAGGWVAVFDDGTQVKMRVVGADGTPSGGEIAVSDSSHHGTQDHPGLAVLGDGRAAVVWCDHQAQTGADIFVQRYDANLSPIPNDQAVAINDVVTAGDQVTPAIAATSAASGSFVAAWIDSGSGHVRARYVDGTSGFDFNPIDGQSTEFQASIAAGPQRKNPTVAIGGAGPYVAIGWDDGANVFVRRFPAPSSQ